MVWWQFKNLYIFKSYFPNFWGKLNAAKVLFSDFDSFREFSSVKELSCTDINIISDLAGILLGSAEPCGSSHHEERNAYGSSGCLDLFYSLEPRCMRWMYHRITHWLRLAGTSGGHLFQPTCPSRDTQSRLPRRLLKIFSEGDFTMTVVLCTWKGEYTCLPWWEGRLNC